MMLIGLVEISKQKSSGSAAALWKNMCLVGRQLRSWLLDHVAIKEEEGSRSWASCPFVRVV